MCGQASGQGSQAAMVGSTGMWLAAPRVTPRVSHWAMQRGQALAVVAVTPGQMAFVPIAQAETFGP